MRYTVRNVPPEVDRWVRQKAKLENKTINQVVIEAWQRSLGLPVGVTKRSRRSSKHRAGK